MNISFAFIGMWEAILIMTALLVFFGAKKLPEMAKGLGQGIREFKKASREVTEDLQRSIDEDPEPPRRLNSPAEPREPRDTQPPTNTPHP